MKRTEVAALISFALAVAGCAETAGKGGPVGGNGSSDMAMPPAPPSSDMAAGGGDGPAPTTTPPDMAEPLPTYPDVTRFVDPIIGTAPANVAHPVAGGSGGSVFPGAVLPWGMVQLSPDTPHGEPSGYAYNDTAITGFS